MSRSRKKNAIVKDPSNSKNKKLASRRLRRISKIAVNQGKEIIPLSKEVTNQYDVCDYSIHATKNDKYYNKFKRK